MIPSLDELFPEAARIAACERELERLPGGEQELERLYGELEPACGYFSRNGDHHRIWCSSLAGTLFLSRLEQALDELRSLQAGSARPGLRARFSGLAERREENSASGALTGASSTRKLQA